MRFSSLSVLSALALLSAPAAARAATVALNISIGHLTDHQGTAPANRLAAETLFMLVADLDGNGFDPVPADSWTGGGDVAVMVYDSEFPSGSGGTRGFDLSSGSTEPGFFSRTLIIDTAQFAGNPGSISLALRWFPTFEGSSGLPTGGPGMDVPYGEFFRLTPKYGESSWTISLSGGASLTLDPYASPSMSGTDPAVQGSATLVTVPEPSGAGLALLALAGLTVVRTRPVRRGFHTA